MSQADAIFGIRGSFVGGSNLSAEADPWVWRDNQDEKSHLDTAFTFTTTIHMWMSPAAEASSVDANKVMGTIEAS